MELQRGKPLELLLMSWLKPRPTKIIEILMSGLLFGAAATSQQKRPRSAKVVQFSYTSSVMSLS
jgi:hypothetical protein